MPTYEYKCDACGHAFEQFQSIMADPVRRCPQCKKQKVKRLLSTGAGLIFKGSGFYITDYREAGYAEKAKADVGGDASGSGDSSGKSDGAKEGGGPKEAKPETKAEAKSGGDAPAAPATPAPKAEPKTASKSASKSSRPKTK